MIITDDRRDFYFMTPNPRRERERKITGRNGNDDKKKERTKKKKSRENILLMARPTIAIIPLDKSYCGDSGRGSRDGANAKNSQVTKKISQSKTNKKALVLCSMNRSIFCNLSLLMLVCK